MSALKNFTNILQKQLEGLNTELNTFLINNNIDLQQNSTNNSFDELKSAVDTCESYKSLEHMIKGLLLYEECCEKLIDTTYSTIKILENTTCQKLGEFIDNPFISCIIGDIYSTGYGRFVKVDYYKAIECYKNSIEKGNTDAFFDLGMIYMCKLHDNTSAFNYFLQGAHMGDFDCQYYVGHFFEEGLSVQKNLDQSLYWYEIASESGNIFATHHLARVLYKNDIYPIDWEKCFKYNVASAINGNIESMERLSTLYTDCKGIGQSPMNHIISTLLLEICEHRKSKYGTAKTHDIFFQRRGISPILSLLDTLLIDWSKKINS